jgi:hypothetical protein
MMADTNILPVSEAAVLDAVTTGIQWQQQRANWLYRGLLAGTLTVTDNDAIRSYAITLHELGIVPIPDGRLVAGDPYVMPADAQPFSQAVPAGEHTAVAAIATIGEGHIRIAAGVIRFANQPIARWEMGRTRSDLAADTFEVGDFTGYGVDAGAGCFASPAALTAVNEVLSADGGMLTDPISHTLDGDLESGVVAPRAGALPIAVFHSGWGDGIYPTWFGYAADGSIAVAVTDFELFEDPYLWDRSSPLAGA